MKSQLHILIFGLAMHLPQLVAAQQREEASYTSPNQITLQIPGDRIRYDYFSNQLLLRLNQQNDRLELRVVLNTFTPGNTGSPQVLLRELFFANAFPELLMSFEVPRELLISTDLQNRNRRLKGTVICQGITREVEADFELVPLSNQFTISTTFGFSLNGPGVQLPQLYADMVQGPVDVIIQNARWINTQQTNR